MDLRESSFDVLRGLHSAFPRHFHIHNNDVRSEPKGQLNGFIPVCGLPNDDERFIAYQKAAEGFAKRTKIVDDENAKAFVDMRCLRSDHLRSSLPTQPTVFSAFGPTLSVQKKTPAVSLSAGNDNVIPRLRTFFV